MGTVVFTLEWASNSPMASLTNSILMKETHVIFKVCSSEARVKQAKSQAHTTPIMLLSIVG